MRIVEAIIRFIVGVPAIGCVIASCYFAYQFGLTRTPDVASQVYFGWGAIAFDVMKTMLPLIGSRAGPGPRRAAWIGFMMLTGFSLWCAFGLNATTLAEKFSAQTAASTALSDAKTALNRAQAERDRIPAFIPTEQGTVDAAQQAVDVATRQKNDECDKTKPGGGRGQHCREREDDERKALAHLSEVQSQKSLTDQARILDARIAKAQAALAKVDVKTAVKDADPQSQSLHELTGIPLQLIQLISGMWWALCIEFGSGVGFWLAFHPTRREEMSPKPEKMNMSTASCPELEQSAGTPIALAPLIDTPNQVRAKFFKTCVLPDPNGNRVGANVMYVAYAKWCADNNYEAMSQQKFGTDPPWIKTERGGQRWYVDCRLIEAYAEKTALRVVNG